MGFKARSITPSAIREALAELTRRDPKCRVFGASAHKYELHSVLAPRDLASFESRFSVGLPQDYRDFLLHVGNGGAGPFYGVFRLGEVDWNHDHATWEKSGLLGDPSEPFQHSKAWNLSPAFFAKEPNYDECDDPDDAYERWSNTLDEEYWGGHIMNGAIPLCHEGCANRYWLVVTGKEAGAMWHDERADQRGIRPVECSRYGNQRVSFSMWYWDWLQTGLGA